MFKLTKNEARLLGLFFTNPGREFYIQEVGRIFRMKPGSFQRTLYNLEKSGILASAYRANARYFRANEAHPLFEEIKSIIFKTVGVTESLKEALCGTGAIDFAFVYGSFARGAENPLSDIDLVIIGSPDESSVLERLDGLERLLKREINYRIYSSLDIVKDLQESEPFLLRVLKEPKAFLIGGEDGLRKLVEGRAPQKSRSGPPTNN